MRPPAAVVLVATLALGACGAEPEIAGEARDASSGQVGTDGSVSADDRDDTSGRDADPAAADEAGAAGIVVTSPDFEEGAVIPERFTCEGDGLVPEIEWSGVPDGVAALAVVVDDPDAPGGTFVHRVVLDLPPDAVSLGVEAPAGSAEARTSASTVGWTPPCPPSGVHHYRFTVYGLGSPTGLDEGAATADAVAAIESSATTEGTLTGVVEG